MGIFYSSSISATEEGIFFKIQWEQPIKEASLLEPYTGEASGIEVGVLVAVSRGDLAPALGRVTELNKDRAFVHFQGHPALISLWVPLAEITVIPEESE